MHPMSHATSQRQKQPHRPRENPAIPTALKAPNPGKNSNPPTCVGSLVRGVGGVVDGDASTGACVGSGPDGFGVEHARNGGHLTDGQAETAKSQVKGAV